MVNLTNVDYSGGTSYTSPIYLRYDALNRLTNMVDAVGTTSYGYDAAGQLLSEDGPWANDTVSYTYTNRLRTALNLSLPSGSWSQSYAYDVTRRLTNITSPAGAFGYAFNVGQASLPVSISLPGGSLITNTYDSVARLTGTYLNNSTNGILDSYVYGYNQGNQRTNVVRTAGDSVNYTYDNMGELKTATGKEAGGTTNRLHEQFGYTYDAAGNLNLRTNNTLLQAFNVNNLNELTSVTNGGRLTVAGTTTVPATNVTVNTSNALLYADATFASTNQPWVNGNNTYTAIGWDSVGNSSTNSVTVNLFVTNLFVYDLNGNMVTNGTMVLDWDDENELIRITQPSAWKTEFTYDGKLRRRIRKEFAWQGGSWVQTNEVHYVLDGNVVIQERDANNNPLVTYTRGNDISGTLQGAGGISGLLARTDNQLVNAGSLYAQAYYHADGNGNITTLIYTNQQTSAKYLYGPFGSILSMSGPLSPCNSYRFSSMEYYDKAGIILYLYRPYISELDRWPNRDPLGEQGFSIAYRHKKMRKVHIALRITELSQGSDLYTFVGNMAVNRYDPFGLQYDSEECKGLLNEIDFLGSLLGRNGIDNSAVWEQMINLTEEYDENCGDDDDNNPSPSPAPEPPCPVRVPSPVPSFCVKHPALCGFGIATGIALGVCIIQPELCIPAIIIAK